MIPNPAHRGNDRRIAVATGDGAVLIVAPENIEFLKPARIRAKGYRPAGMVASRAV